MIYTGNTRSANSILKQQNEAILANENVGEPISNGKACYKFEANA